MAHTKARTYKQYVDEVEAMLKDGATVAANIRSGIFKNEFATMLSVEENAAINKKHATELHAYMKRLKRQIERALAHCPPL